MARPQELERARKALACVQEIKKEEKPELEKKYSSYVKSAPSMILANGLGQSLAFWKAKAVGDKIDAKAYKFILTHLDKNVEKDIFNKVINEYSSEQYRIVTAKTLEFLKWLKKFATAELKSDDSIENGR